jgi:hypothetical protein
MALSPASPRPIVPAEPEIAVQMPAGMAPCTCIPAGAEAAGTTTIRIYGSTGQAGTAGTGSSRGWGRQGKWQGAGTRESLPFWGYAMERRRVPTGYSGMLQSLTTELSFHFVRLMYIHPLPSSMRASQRYCALYIHTSAPRSV